MNSIEQHIMFAYTEKLRYEQYGLNDYFWELDKSKTQWKREVEPQLNIENIKPHVKSNLGLPHNLVRKENKKSHESNITDHHKYGDKHSDCGTCHN
jgi:hypothetical protein